MVDYEVSSTNGELVSGWENGYQEERLVQVSGFSQWCIPSGWLVWWDVRRGLLRFAEGTRST